MADRVLARFRGRRSGSSRRDGGGGGRDTSMAAEAPAGKEAAENEDHGEMEDVGSGDEDAKIAEWNRLKDHIDADDRTDGKVPFRDIVGLFVKMEFPYQAQFGKLGMEPPTKQDRQFIEGLKFKTAQALNALCTSWDREHPTAQNCDELVRHLSEAMHMVDVDAERWARVHAWMKNRMEEVAFNHSLGKA